MIDMLTNVNGEALKLSDYLQIITLITVVLGGCFALFQWNNSEKVRKAALMKELLQKVREDPDFCEVLYMIDYWEKEWYPDEFKKDHELEEKVDKVFTLFDYICFLKNNRILSKSEFLIFKYEILRLSSDKSSVRYLYNIYHFSRTNGQKCSFHNLIKYMYRNNLLPENFLIAKYDEDTILGYDVELNNSLRFMIQTRLKRSFVCFVFRRISDFYVVYLKRNKK